MISACDLGVPRPAPVADLDWSPADAAGLGHDAVELWRDLLTALPDLPVQRGAVAADVAAAVAWDVPHDPGDLKRLVEDTRTLLLQWSMYPGHGGFLGYVSGAGTIPGAAADLLAAAVNNNAGAWRLAPGLTELEQRLLRWFADRLGLPATAGGYLTSGGSAANHDALLVARDRKAGWDVRRLGAGAGPRLTAYAPVTAHDTVQRAADMIGLGHDAVRLVPVDARDHVDVAAMRAAVEADLASGHRPFCVVGTAGTVGTGTVDDLVAIADLAEAFDLWFHVDGAVGAVGALVEPLRGRFDGIERADSIGLDPHKWLYVPIACGMLLVRDDLHLSQAFHVDPTYTVEARPGRGPPPPGGDQRSRTDDRHVPLRARRPPVAGGGRRAQPAADGAVADSGRVYPSNAFVAGRFALRACIVNFRTEADDIEALVDLAVRHGDDLAAA